MRVQAETPGPPARDAAKRCIVPADGDKDRLDWKGAQRQKDILLVCARFQFESGFCFFRRSKT
jgi:hypothetical protein